MILIIDNYDSFTYNLYQYLRELTDEPVEVVRNDAVDLDQIAARAPRQIIISPGPGRPEAAGISVEVTRRFAPTTPILGVCLGHQVIGLAFGAEIVRSANIVHGKVEAMELDGRGLFRSIPSPAQFTRYHSLAIAPESLPDELEISAWAPDGEIMGVRHKRLVVEGVQFHPESIASEHGKRLLSNFLQYRREPLIISNSLRSLLDGVDMNRGEAVRFMEDLTDGNLTSAQIGAMFVALNAKGIAAEEIAGCAQVLIAKRRPFHSARPVLDTCGTGGDGLGTFNISSMAALLATTCGAIVAKHGNRAVSSRSGSADFYRALGFPIDLAPEQSERLLARTGFAFLFAPLYHGAMRHATAARRDLGIKTIMNLLGPLVNPAGATFQLIGVSSRSLCAPVARAAHLLGIKRVMVVHGEGGEDEISIGGTTWITRIDADGVSVEERLHPHDFGLDTHTIDEIVGGDAQYNARLAREMLVGKGSVAIRDAVLLNTAAALMLYGVVSEIGEGVSRVRQVLNDGTARTKIDEIISHANDLATPSDRSLAPT